MRAEGRAEGRRPREPLGDVERGDFVEAEAAVRLRHVDAEQPELRALLHQLAREVPVLLLELIEFGKDLVLDELLRRAADEQMLLGELLGREDAVGFRRLEQEFAAAQDRRVSGRRHRHTLSKIPAAPMPPPTHIVTMP